MRAQATTPAFIGVAVVAIAILAVASGLLPTGSGITTTSGPDSTTTPSVDGLALTVRISSTEIGAGGSVILNVSETNTNYSPLNESASTAWAVQGLRMSECYASIYPFGVAVFQGHYGKQNVTSGTPLNLYPLVPCPLLLRYISGYYFQPSSDVAVVLPGSGQGVAMAAGVVARGSYASGSTLNHFGPGEYTVVAGDEWGSLAFLYFTVT